MIITIINNIVDEEAYIIISLFKDLIFILTNILYSLNYYLQKNIKQGY